MEHRADNQSACSPDVGRTVSGCSLKNNVRLVVRLQFTNRKVLIGASFFKRRQNVSLQTTGFEAVPSF